MLPHSTKISLLMLGVCAVFFCDGPFGGVRTTSAFVPGAGRCIPGSLFNKYCHGLSSKMTVSQMEKQSTDASKGMSRVTRLNRCIPGAEMSWWCRYGRSEGDVAEKKVSEKKESAYGLDTSLDCTGPGAEDNPMCRERQRRVQFVNRGRQSFGNRCIPGEEFNYFCRGRKSQGNAQVQPKDFDDSNGSLNKWQNDDSIFEDKIRELLGQERDGELEK
ncbi:uncharacterized protein LOC100379065 [Saccoglossus kowalevskii]|uniref:Uncharacterized protein LOC100379065 n=1 Tax=Saccoglossus kowalevskii TaxID=10224 RepID=A0ABM0MGZ9_SACKO|nr:PREDICTED: uncharacterized protein LOC100379065 [Saccoglossus kowalevskii]